MSASNFYEDGNHGLNVIVVPDEEDSTVVEDTIQNICDELNEIGYSIDHLSLVDKTPRSYETGQNFAVFSKKNKVVAIFTLCAGYYSGANINIYTGYDHLTDEYERDEITVNKRDIERVVRVIKNYTESFNRVATFSNGESIYERNN